MKTKTITALINQKALFLSRNGEKNLKNDSEIKTTESTTNYIEFSPKFVLFSS